MSHNDSDDITRSYAQLASGTEIGHYRIIERIGVGGMGEVYLAEDTALNRKVALKFLPLQLCQDADCRARFKREAQAAAKLGHANIVAVHEVGEYNARPFIVMELVEGRPLDKIIPADRLNENEIVELALGICNGLRKAHESGVIHRDIKPSNIIVDQDNVPRLLDFGLAVVRDSDKLTQTGSVPGTIAYLSPEQVAGRAADARSDLFSLGVVLYEMTTGVNPFRRDNQAATLKAISDDFPKPLESLRNGISRELQRCIGKLLEKRPELRYQTAADLAADLRRMSGTSPKAGGTSGKRWLLSTGLIFVLVAAVAGYFLTHNRAPVPTRTMLAVLPFENLGAPEDEYFADGMTEEVTTNLAGLSALGVISRTSSMQYKRTKKSLKQIGRELKVDYVLEGTIRWEKTGSESHVRISPQLIRVADDSHVWANHFDAVVTDVFQVQSTIAREVASALDVTLIQSERDVLAQRPEVDPKAYEYYLRGRQYFSIARYGQNEPRIAEKMFLRAIELAPEFTQAYAELSILYTEIHWEQADSTPFLLDSAKKLVDIAMRLDPNTAEPHEALGWYYYHGLRDFNRAVEEFSKVLELQPSNVPALASIAWVQRRQGKWQEAIRGLQLVNDLDPRDPWYKYELGITYHYCRRFQDAIAQFTQVTDLQPDYKWAYVLKSWALLNETGETREARSVLDAGRTVNGRWPELTWLEVYYDLCDRQYAHALSLLTGPGSILSPEHPDASDYYSMKGFTYKLMERPQIANIYFDSARVQLESALIAATNPAPLLSSLAVAYAGLGQADKAVLTAERATELVPVATDALDGPKYLRVLAMVCAQVGQQDRAVELIAELLNIPSNVSVNALRLAPELSALCDNQRFQNLITRGE